MIETNDIYNLAATFSYLSEIDTGLLGKEQQDVLGNMKDKVLSSLAYLIDALPDFEENTED